MGSVGPPGASPHEWHTAPRRRIGGRSEAVPSLNDRMKKQQGPSVDQGSAGRSSPETLVQFGGLLVGALRYVGFWGVVWLAQLVVAPNWFVDGRSGLETVFQVLPPVVIAIYALVLASVFVVVCSALPCFSRP